MKVYWARIAKLLSDDVEIQVVETVSDRPHPVG